MCMCLCVYGMKISPWKPKNGTGFLGTEVAGDCDGPNVGAGNPTWVHFRSVIVAAGRLLVSCSLVPKYSQRNCII